MRMIPMTLLFLFLIGCAEEKSWGEKYIEDHCEVSPESCVTPASDVTPTSVPGDVTPDND